MANNYCMATVSPELPARLFDEEELSLLQAACGLSWERQGDSLYFFAEGGFREQGDDGDGLDVDCTDVFQEKLRLLDAETYPGIAIHGAATCSKMRADEFGGFAIYITRDAVRSFSTWEWLERPQHCAQPPAAGQQPYSVLLLYPDYAGDFGRQTYYAFVVAADPIDAVAIAQREAAEAQDGLEIDDPTDFYPLLVTEGHQPSQPLFNR